MKDKAILSYYEPKLSYLYFAEPKVAITLPHFQHFICVVKIGKEFESFISCGNICYILFPRRAIVSLSKDLLCTF